LTCWDRFKGNFSWLKTTYDITDEQVKDRSGSEALLYLTFLK